MKVQSKIIFLLVILVLGALLVIYGPNIVDLMKTDNSDTPDISGEIRIKGPTGPPSIKGPTGPPPE